MLQVRGLIGDLQRQLTVDWSKCQATESDCPGVLEIGDLVNGYKAAGLSLPSQTSWHACFSSRISRRYLLVLVLGYATSLGISQ